MRLGSSILSGVPILLDYAKSMSLILFYYVIKIFCGFKSLCTIPS